MLENRYKEPPQHNESPRVDVQPWKEVDGVKPWIGLGQIVIGEGHRRALGGAWLRKKKCNKPRGATDTDLSSPLRDALCLRHWNTTLNLSQTLHFTGGKSLDQS